LLADLLQVFTGSDLLVRPVHGGGTGGQLSVPSRSEPTLVQVQSPAIFCLPTGEWALESGGTLVRISFCSQPDRPFVKYQLEAIRPSVQPNDPAWTLITRRPQMLGHLDIGDDNDAMHRHLRQWRTAFVMCLAVPKHVSGAVGIRSAWQEIDTVAGF
jgi:hypothetical protein